MRDVELVGSLSAVRHAQRRLIMGPLLTSVTRVTHMYTRSHVVMCVCVSAVAHAVSPHGSLYLLKLMSWQWNSVSALGIGATSSH